MPKDLVRGVLNLVISGIPSIRIRSIRIWKRMWYVLNLIISGLPSIPWTDGSEDRQRPIVLNLIVTGLPSILQLWMLFNKLNHLQSFKPYYNWTTFNTSTWQNMETKWWGFKPCYKWNTFNTVLTAKEIVNI